MTETLIEKLKRTHDLSDAEFMTLIEDESYQETLMQTADAVRRDNYDTDVYIRGLIEISNYCTNNCHYCGIRAGNEAVTRYRLSPEEILDCCRIGYKLGFRTFVLQGGEDAFFTDELICQLVRDIKATYPDCAVTLSLGEKSPESFKAYREAGADRYLLRHETANDAHYKQLHPRSMSPVNRKACLFELKELGYQVGSGFMVGSPFQTTEHLLEDLRFLQKLQPDMIGIGPYLSHADTPFAKHPNGDLNKCLRIIAILRLMFPYALLPSTTAMGTLSNQGRELGIKAGANVVMPNLSPVSVRKLYSLYDNKICTGDEAAECRVCLHNKIAGIGYNIVSHVGHAKSRQMTEVV